MRALHEEMRACRRCLEAGHEITPGAVFTGSAAASVMLVGQAPGITEVTAKRPFNASSGRRLFQWLEAAGWEEDSFRSEQYMTAVTKCYPGRSSSGKGDRVPSRAEQALCRTFLEREISHVKPRLMILVGGLAIKLLYPASARLKDIIGTAHFFGPDALVDPVNFHYKEGVRRQAFDPELNHTGRWVVPLPHPSGASLWPNKPANKKLIAQAIQLLDDIRTGLDL